MHQGVNLELSPLLVDIFRDGLERYGLLGWSSSIIKRLEEQACVKALGQGFAALLVYDESAGPSHEVTVQN